MRCAAVALYGVIVASANLATSPREALAAAEIGVAAAVNPQATGHAGGVTRQLAIGKNILFNERIATSASGLVQVLFVDGSTITVGPNSDLVIDKFVYDPRTEKGELVATFTKGALRFVGGKVSKQDGGVTMRTPAGTLGVRGGMFQGALTDGRGTFSFLFGDKMTFDDQTIFEPNYSIEVGAGGAPLIRPTRPEDAQFFVGLLSGQGGGGASQKPTDGQVRTSGVSDANSNDQDNQQGNPIQRFNDARDNAHDTGGHTTTQDLVRKLLTNASPPPGVETVGARILTRPVSFTAFVGTPNQVAIPDPKDSGLLGGDPDQDLDDFVTTASIVNGRLRFTVSGLLAFTCEPPPCPATPIPPHHANFPFYRPGSTQNLLFTLADLSMFQVLDATVRTPDATELWVGTLAAAPGFFAYQLFFFDPDQQAVNARDHILAFGGAPFPLGPNQGQGMLRSFSLLTDPVMQNLFPFASTTSSPDDPTGATVSPLFLLEQNFGVPGASNQMDDSRSVWMQTSFQIDGAGPGQESFILVAAGLAIDGGDGAGLFGERRGGGRAFNTELQGETHFTGGLATLSGPDGNHLFGTSAPSFVIGFDSTNAGFDIGFGAVQNNIGTDEPRDMTNWTFDELHGATYHVGTQTSAEAAPAKTSESWHGFAAAMMQTRDPVNRLPGGIDFNPVANLSPLDFSIALDAGTDALAAMANVLDVQDADADVRDYLLRFGTVQDAGISAYIDGATFAAFETPGASQVTDNQGVAYVENSAQLYLVGGGLLNNQQIFGSAEAFCDACDFLKWGAWGGRVAFGDGQQQAKNDFFHMGWWVAGDIATEGQMNGMTGTATYTGQAIGNVANNLDGQGWRHYVAHGGMNMSWDFGQRSGTLNVTNFDTSVNNGQGFTFTGAMSAPANFNAADMATFGGALAGPNTMTGGATGAFVNNGVNDVAAGVAGNWHIANGDYGAVGVFAGRK